MSTVVLETQHLAVGYRRPLARDLSLCLRRGELVCLLGPNGAGKSTLMRTLLGMQRPLAGSVLVQGADARRISPAAMARTIAVVLTDRVEVGYMSVAELVALGRYPHTDWSGHLTDADYARVRWAMQVTDTAAFAQRQIAELSDGERQRVMIARALAQDTPLIMLDEPTAFLDLPHRVLVMALLRRLSREAERAILLSTHDLDLALRYADRLWLLGRDGTFIVGDPDELRRTKALARVFGAEGHEVMRYLEQVGIA